MEEKIKYALQGFNEGKNCAQSVIMAYANEFGMNTEQAMYTAGGFGGGMGRMQKTCGAATGAFMLIGMRNSHLLGTEDTRSITPTMIQDFSKRFETVNGSDQCSELLKLDLNTLEGQEDFKIKELKKEVCSKCVSSAIEILEDMFIQ